MNYRPIPHPIIIYGVISKWQTIDYKNCENKQFIGNMCHHARKFNIAVLHIIRYNFEFDNALTYFFHTAKYVYELISGEMIVVIWFIHMPTQKYIQTTDPIYSIIHMGNYLLYQNKCMDLDLKENQMKWILFFQLLHIFDCYTWYMG